jgi:tetratricopeptide (TPR) repeat protein
VIRTSLVFLAASLASCGGGGGFQRPDYAGEARALCDQAEATADTNRALSLYGMALNADPRHARAYLGRARIFERTGRAAEAERSYSMAVDSADDDVRSLYLMERARYMRGLNRIEAMVRDLDRAIGLLDSWPNRERMLEARLQRAECRIKLHAWERAAEDLEAAERAGLDGARKDRARELRVRLETGQAEDRR